MKTVAPLVALRDVGAVLFLMACLSSCGGDAAAATDCNRCRITEADDGGQWTLAPSASASIRLSNSRLWSSPTIEGRSVELSQVAYESDPGYTEWTVRATQQGATRVTFEGRHNPPANDDQVEISFHFDVS